MFWERDFWRKFMSAPGSGSWPCAVYAPRLRFRFRFATRGSTWANTWLIWLWRKSSSFELKCVDRFANEHLAQCINYLKASGLGVALLINFQRPKVEWKRVLLDS